MTPEQADHAIQFLNRAQLSGAEVAPFVDVVNALEGIRSGNVRCANVAEPPRRPIDDGDEPTGEPVSGTVSIGTGDKTEPEPGD